MGRVGSPLTDINRDTNPEVQISLEGLTEKIRELEERGLETNDPNIQELIEEMRGLLLEVITYDEQYEVGELNRLHIKKYGKIKAPQKKKENRTRDLDLQAVFRKAHRILARCPKFSADSKNVSVLPDQNPDSTRTLAAKPELTPHPTPSLQNSIKNQPSNAPKLTR